MDDLQIITTVFAVIRLYCIPYKVYHKKGVPLDPVLVQVVSLQPLVHKFSGTFNFAPDLLLGEMVVPHLTANFGPTYMCKLRRLS